MRKFQNPIWPTSGSGIEAGGALHSDITSQHAIPETAARTYLIQLLLHSDLLFSLPQMRGKDGACSTGGGVYFLLRTGETEADSDFTHKL